jgi:hypothetical protein
MLSYAKTLKVAAVLRDLLPARHGHRWPSIAAEVVARVGFHVPARCVRSVAAALGLEPGEKVPPTAAERAAAAVGERMAVYQEQVAEAMRQLGERIAALEGKPAAPAGKPEVWEPARGWSAGRRGQNSTRGTYDA